MAGVDNVTYKFRIDLSQMTVEGEKAIKILERMDRASNKASTGVDKLKGSVDKVRPSTAAAAINFQTATQGMLNLSTAAVQTYTSISNLDRANNRAKMSVIAVARAEDLLANKIERQNTLRAAGAEGSQKDINITKEIATAKADLTVKTEKMGIEQAAVNDIYMLFATNIANVTISSMQTIAILDKNSVILNGLKVAGMKIHNFLSLGAARNAYKQAAAETVNSTAKVAATGVTAGLTAAMFGLAAATRAVVAANPILLAAMAGLTVAWAVHESDILGTKTALDGYLNTEEDHLKLMEEERIAAEGLTQANGNLEKSYKKLTPVTKQYMEMMRDAAIQTGNARLAAQYSAQLIGKRPQDFSSASSGGGFSGGTGIVTGTGTGTGGGSTAASVDGGFLPSAYGDSDTGGTQTSVATPAPATSDPTKADPFGTVLQQELYKGLNPIEQRDTNIILAAAEQNSGRSGSSKKYLEKARQLTQAANSYVEPEHFTFADILKDPSMTSGSFFGTNNAQKKSVVNPALNDFKYGIDIATREGIDPKSTRGKVLNKTGRDIGSIADHIDVNEGIRLANLETSMSGFRNTKGGKASLAIAAVGGNATQAWQVPRGSIRASDEFYARIAEQDRLTNLKRFGGYSSRQAQSRASNARFYSSVDEAQIMMKFFGDEINSSVIRGRSSRRSEYQRIMNKGAMYKSTLASAGLSYKTIRTNLGSRPDRHRVIKLQQELNEVISYNNNQYAKAGHINMLEQDFDVRGYVGSSMSLPSLQDAVARQDEMIKSIGLNRTEAFQIIDTEGRGREEIDDRILWKDRVNNISTGNNVL